MTEQEMKTAAGYLADEWRAGNRERVIHNLASLPPLGAAYVAIHMLRTEHVASRRVAILDALAADVKEKPWPAT